MERSQGMSGLLRLRKTSENPPDNLPLYRAGEDGWPAISTNKQSWFAKIEKYYRDNNFTLPDNSGS